MKFFEKTAVKVVNNIVIITASAFTAYLLLNNLPWYLPNTGDGESIIPGFYLIIFSVIAISVYSSTNIHYLKMLSIATTWLFVCLIILIWSLEYIFAETPISTFFQHLFLLGGYFTHIERFVLPINSHHEFYLFWWFAWSIMIGQFTSRFVGGLKTYQLLGAMLIFPSIPIAAWFTVLYHFHDTNANVQGLVNLAMVTVGIVFVINSLDSLIRLYTDNLNLTVQRLGKWQYISFNIIVLSLLTFLFQLDFLEIQWIGAIVIGLIFSCFAFIVWQKLRVVCEISGSPTENSLDFKKIEKVT